MSDGSSDEEDYDAFEDVADAIEKKYPLHDCVEFEDIETLRVSENSVNQRIGWPAANAPIEKFSYHSTRVHVRRTSSHFLSFF